MISKEKIYVQGCGWISTEGCGQYGSKPVFTLVPGPYRYPDLGAVIAGIPSRYGRFDDYTRLCFGASALALHDAGMEARVEKENIGIVIGTRAGSADGDDLFFESTRESEGEFSSPNTFSYTLPNVALGEVAVFFKLNGPTFCTGNDPDAPGRESVNAVLSMILAGVCQTALVGWVETAKNDKKIAPFPKGAFLAVLSSGKNGKTKAEFAAGELRDLSVLMK